jgi:nitrilase
MVKVAIVQEPPILLDRAATLARVVGHIETAARDGVLLISFPESYVPGYPEWVWRLRPWQDAALGTELFARLIGQAVDLAGGDLDPVRAAARAAGMTVVLGIHERSGYSGTTLYNTVVTIGPDGAILNRHRKLVPTNPERMIWGPGDAAGLRTVPTPVGRVGALVCWESYMPLARFALYADGVEVYVAPTWDHGEAWRATLQHIAKEGRVWVLGNGCCFQASDVPEGFPGRDKLYPDPAEWINGGDSLVVDPMGKVVAGPLQRDKGVLRAEIDPGKVAAARRTMDVAGHYGRPDVFKLEVVRTPAAPVAWKDD